MDLCALCHDVGFLEEPHDDPNEENYFRLCPADGCVAAQEAFDALKEDSDGLYQPEPCGD